jgi:hypothetical protein
MRARGTTPVATESRRSRGATTTSLGSPEPTAGLRSRGGYHSFLVAERRRDKGPVDGTAVLSTAALPSLFTILPPRDSADRGGHQRRPRRASPRPHAAEVIKHFAVAVRLKIPAAEPQEVIFAYPTYGSDIGFML